MLSREGVLLGKLNQSDHVWSGRRQHNSNWIHRGPGGGTKVQRQCWQPEPVPGGLAASLPSGAAENRSNCEGRTVEPPPPNHFPTMSSPNQVSPTNVKGKMKKKSVGIDSGVTRQTGFCPGPWPSCPNAEKLCRAACTSAGTMKHAAVALSAAAHAMS